MHTEDKKHCGLFIRIKSIPSVRKVAMTPADKSCMLTNTGIMQVYTYMQNTC